MSVDLSRLARQTALGRLARLPLKLLPREMPMPILQGPLAGRRWIVGSSTHGCWLGSYEWQKQRDFFEAARHARTVYDVGAHVGFYTMLASVAVGSAGTVAAFEPLPRNLRYLREHVRLNDLSNVRVFATALAEGRRAVRFAEGNHSSMGHFAHEDESGELLETVSLDEMAAEQRLPDPDLMKVDVEGAEVDVLKGAEQTIRHARPQLFLATHSEDLQRTCISWLTERGYRVDRMSADELNARVVR